jgi:hypothetical protein
MIDDRTACVRLPSISGLTANEMAWIDFIRLLSEDRDLPPTLAAVQALRVELR